MKKKRLPVFILTLILCLSLIPAAYAESDYESSKLSAVYHDSGKPRLVDNVGVFAERYAG